MFDRGFVSEKKSIIALQDIFRKLQCDSLPVSPSVLVESFGWNTRNPNESSEFLQPWLHLWDYFKRVPDLREVHERLLVMKYWRESSESASLVSHEGSSNDLKKVSVHPTADQPAHISLSMKDGAFVTGMREACKMGGLERPDVGRKSREYRHLPPVLITEIISCYYDFKINGMMIVITLSTEPFLSTGT
jgi:hypothetical protein